MLFQLLNIEPHSRVGCEELRWSGCHDREALIESGVLVEGPPVDYVSACCDECDHHGVVRLEGAGGTKFYEACPHGNFGSEVHPDELRQWSVDGDGVANMLASSLASDGKAETLLPRAAWRIGDLQIGGESFPVVLAINRVALQLAERSGASRMIVIGDRLSADGFAGCLDFDEAIDTTDHGIVLREHRLRQLIPFNNIGTGNAFYRKGQMWVVRFGGDEVYLENNVGPLYIARLLASPNRAVPAVTLLASRIGIDEQKLTGSSGELADEEAVNDCRARYCELMNEIEEAESHNDQGRLAVLQVEQDQLTSHFASVLGKGGRRRDVGDAKKVRQSVSKGIQRTLDVLEIELKPLADHLNARLNLGACPMYSAPADMHWLV